MYSFKKSSDLISYLQGFYGHKSIGFVPTMGALHSGHISLIDAALKSSDIVVCSIFVNPTQFNNENDLATYPKTIGNDLKLLANAGCHVVYLPDVSDIYQTPPMNYDLSAYGIITKVLESEKRPGHFNGVIDVVTRLFNIVKPNQVFFGQKDYQQCMIVKKLIELNNWPIQFNMCPLVRELDGLAMSSRNIRLNPQERENALALFKTLNFIKSHWPGSPLEITELAFNYIAQFRQVEVEYIAICHPYTLEKLQHPLPKAVALIAAQVGSTRLIDNMILGN